ncbi:serpin family protein [Arcticibacterium luteifluviistationis]|uniref:Serpin family protein n=1 Tax=Arcticibacterium luteifluviistationis TaxID=1784714 RepID=A0A2Z4G9N8_9BACT|nr:serpin family protein [Arcticibacterium luteifluviistationis]AWV97795.1 serpin family protein [Arcticibacterium luteifluviistationis]
MKKTFFTILLGTILLMNSCTVNSPSPQGVDVTLDAEFSKRTTSFAFDFLKELEKEEVDETFFVSPLSLHMALGMLLNGADTQSKEELIKTLNLEGLDMDLINSSYLELVDKLPNVDPLVTNELANSLWQRNGFDVEDDFKAVLKEYFKAELYEENFDQGTLTKINQWASDNTNAKITKVLEEISADQVLFLMNALYFKGDWANQFDKDKTFEDSFNGKSGLVKVDMMANLDTFAYADMGSFKAVDLPYGNQKYGMRVLLPKENDVSALLNSLDEDVWKGIDEKMYVQKLDLKLPKFKMEYEIKLNDILKNMGMPSLFSNAADLSKITAPAGKIRVGFVKQNSFVAVDEEGTEAAAVTTIGIELTSVPSYPSFYVNKPFLFFIYEKGSGTIQFAGKILDIEK